VLLIAKQQELLEGSTSRLALRSSGSSSPSARRNETLNTGSIDYGAAGDAPPIFAQSARANLLYVAAQPVR
jgi:ABC-type nitrate/sulfonate/bicarbonate transport system substrate-binding protein